MVPGPGIPPGLEDDGAKAELDVEELTAGLPREQQKVELDLEDAPFLEEEEEEEEEQPEEQSAAPVALDPAPKTADPWYRRRKIIIPAGVGLLLLLVLLAWLALRPGSEPAPEPPAPAESAEAPPPPPAPEPEQPKDYMVTLAPFWVEKRDDQGTVRFLVCQFTAVTQDEKFSFEISQKTTILRDAVYYYLKNKDLTYLSDKNNVETLKADLLSVMNQYLSVGRLETILVDQYLVK